MNSQQEAFSKYNSFVEIKKIIETTSSYLGLTEDDIIIIIDKPIIKSKKSMLEVIEALEELCEGKKKACLSDPSELLGFEKGVRKLIKPHINEKFTHFAIMNPSPIAHVLLAFFLKVDGLKIKYKTFSKPVNAFEWIRSHQESKKSTSRDMIMM